MKTSRSSSSTWPHASLLRAFGVARDLSPCPSSMTKTFAPSGSRRSTRRSQRRNSPPRLSSLRTGTMRSTPSAAVGRCTCLPSGPPAADARRPASWTSRKSSREARRRRIRREPYSGTVHRRGPRARERGAPPHFRREHLFEEQEAADSGLPPKRPSHCRRCNDPPTCSYARRPGGLGGPRIVAVERGRGEVSPAGLPPAASAYGYWLPLAFFFRP